MALGMPLPGGRITQDFGPSLLAIQPAMFHLGRTKAFWQWFAGSQYGENVHAGTDFAGMRAGSPLVAAEAGIVTRSEYDAYNGGGHVIEVEIRDGTRYSYNHCQTRFYGVGAKVAKGQRIATVGATGTIWTGTQFIRSSYGVHCHAVLTIVEKGTDGVTRTMLHNFADFMDGGSRAGASIIRPVAVSKYPKTVVKHGVNIRSTPDLDVGGSNIAYVSLSDGIYTPGGVKVAPANARWQRRGSVTNDDGSWVKIFGLNRYLWVYASLVYYV